MDGVRARVAQGNVDLMGSPVSSCKKGHRAALLWSDEVCGLLSHTYLDVSWRF